MELKFDSALDYQQEAIAAVRDVFKGQSAKQPLFTITATNEQLYMRDNQLADGQCIGNRLELSKDELLKNIQAVELRNGLAPSSDLGDELNLDIEMETGTGKTYVYLRTLLELNKSYGFTKFIIVVPSIAIKEGVKKTIDITRDHFRTLYDNVNYNGFVYDGKHIEKIRDFATSDDIQIMVITISAFQNDKNIINSINDKKFGEAKPIEFVQATHPIVIIDEPQSSISTDDRVEAVRSLNPLCTIRYSATPIRVENKIYRLNAVASFEKKLVKGIEVDSLSVRNDHNNAYLLLKSVNNKKMPITAKIEMDVKTKGEVKRKIVTVKQGDDLYIKSGSRDIYEGYIVNDIYCAAGNEYVDFTSKSDILRLGKPLGAVADDTIKKQQIRSTIEEHLNKELALNQKGIKVLSLFFIDRVASYRQYGENGEHLKGKYAQWFEESYRELIRKPKYLVLLKSLHNEKDEAESVHTGYFSSDKSKGNWKDTKGDSEIDNFTYNLIMKDKERLLSFDCKTRFIFSHSALKEGWDNPNVFQICTLNETASTIKKRQEIGRGLRLCVNQNGERQYDPEINVLTVMANESYEEFASTLQKEYEADGIRFGVLESANFAAMIQPSKEVDEPAYLGMEKADEIMTVFRQQGYIDSNGKVQDSLKLAIKDNSLLLPEELIVFKPQIEEICRKAAGKLPIVDKQKRQKIELNKKVFLSPEFKELWEKIKWKTTYRVDFSTDKLLEKCRERLASEELIVPAAKIIKNRAGLIVGIDGVSTNFVNERPVDYSGHIGNLPDVVGYLQNETNLTRCTIVEILTGTRKDNSGKWQPFDNYGNRLKDFQRNPQVFMEEAAKIIRSVMRKLIVDGIRYQKIGETEYYCQELFENKELTGYLESNLLESHKGLYDYVIFDSENERKFAEAFERNENILLYAKLPGWFTIPTPLGSYNPDWVVIVNKDGEKKLYFVLETKGNIDFEALRDAEKGKIKCGEAHFKSLGNEVEFRSVDMDKFTKIMDSI